MQKRQYIVTEFHSPTESRFQVNEEGTGFFICAVPFGPTRTLNRTEAEETAYNVAHALNAHKWMKHPHNPNSLVES